MPANGLFPIARYCHKSTLISNERYLLVFAGLNVNRQTLGDMILFDINKSIWIPIAQAGFIPTNEDKQFGRYNFGMDYDKINNRLIIFGGQSNKGTFCKPILNLFQLPDFKQNN